MKRLSFVLVIAALLLLSGSLLPAAISQVHTQAPTPSDDDVNRVAHLLYCPVCENTPLDVCPTEACRQWREVIRQKLTEGWSEQRIQEYFVTQYGARVLAEPPRTGLNWMIYVLPPIFILAGALLLVRSFRSWRQPANARAAAQGPSEEATPPEDEYVRRLEEELKRRG